MAKYTTGRIFLPQRRKDAKFGGKRYIFLELIFTSFSELCGVGAFAGDIPNFACGRTDLA